MSPTTTSTPPTAWPLVTLGGRSYVSQFDQFTFFLASEWKYDLIGLLGQVVSDAQNPTTRIAEAYAPVLKLWALFVARNFKQPERPMKGDEWAMALPDDNFESWRVILQAVLDTVGKRQADRTPKTNPEPPKETVTMPTTTQ